MPALVQLSASDLSDRLARAPADRSELLEAAMAASAFVAMADGVLHAAERDIVASVRQRVESMRAFDAKVAADRYRVYLHDLSVDAEAGRAQVLAAVGRFAGDADTASLLMQVCLLVAVADRAVSQPEYAAIQELGQKLGVELGEPEA